MVGTGRYLRLGQPSAQVERRYEASLDKHVVLDVAGRPLWEHPVCKQLCAILRVQWAGPSRLFVGTSGEFNDRVRRIEGQFIALPSGFASPARAFGGWLQCFSPSGRYAVLLNADDSIEVIDVYEGKSLIRTRTGSYNGSCGWSKDEKLLIVSSGGS